jgi:hypothetical protein
MDTNIPQSSGSGSQDALIDTLIESKSVRVQRMITRTPTYRLDSLTGPASENNFLLLLKGRASTKGDNQTAGLKAGDYIITSPQRKNAVEAIAQEEENVWLSVQFNGEIKEGLFPSPDNEILKYIKESIKLKRNVFPRIESLLETQDIRVERITSVAETASVGTCENPWNQFVLVLEGEAVLELAEERANLALEGAFAGRSQTGPRLLETKKVSLKAGDYITIAPHTSGRVDSTKKDAQTVMLSIYY